MAEAATACRCQDKRPTWLPPRYIPPRLLKKASKAQASGRDPVSWFPAAGRMPVMAPRQVQLSGAGVGRAPFPSTVMAGAIRARVAPCGVPVRLFVAGLFWGGAAGSAWDGMAGRPSSAGRQPCRRWQAGQSERAPVSSSCASSGQLVMLPHEPGRGPVREQLGREMAWKLAAPSPAHGSSARCGACPAPVTPRAPLLPQRAPRRHTPLS